MADVEEHYRIFEARASANAAPNDDVEDHYAMYESMMMAKSAHDDDVEDHYKMYESMSSTNVKPDDHVLMPSIPYVRGEVCPIADVEDHARMLALHRLPEDSAAYGAYSYQAEAFQLARRQDLIVVMPTGSGKTMIAAMLIDAFAGPQSLALFACSAAAVVDQQAAYLQRVCRSGINVATAKGGSTEGPCAFVGTAEAVLRRLPQFAGNSITVVVLDEAHHAVGDHPYVTLIDAVRKHCAYRPRTLGLTASWLHGDFVPAQAQGKLRALESTVGATVFIPQVKAAECKFTHVPHVAEEWVDSKPAAEMAQWINECVWQLHPELSSTLLKNAAKAHVLLHSLGPQALSAFPAALCDLVSAQIESKAAHAPDPSTRDWCTQAMAALPLARERLGTPEGWLPPVSGAPNSKAGALLRLLEQHRDGQTIVFVEQVICALPLAAMISSALGEMVLPVCGTLSMPERTRASHLAAFRAGTVRVVVATASLEEGLDVPACSCVIRFDAFSSVKSHVQGAGRARALGAEVFYFGNSPEEEAERSAAALNVARGVEASEARIGTQQTGLNVPDAFAVIGQLGTGDGHKWGEEATMWDVRRNASFRGQSCACGASLRITSRAFGKGKKKKERVFSVEGPYICPNVG